MGRDLRYDLSDDEVPTLAHEASLQDEDSPDPMVVSLPTNRDADHHTIVDMNLRTVRFVIVAAAAMGVAFTYAFLTNSKLVVARLANKTLAENKVSVYNTLLGTVMFTASKVFEIYTETLIFPTLHTYLHNCSLYPGDEPQRVTSKVKTKCIFWGLKTVIILMNVGTSSLFVSQRQHVVGSPSVRMLTVSDVHARRLQDSDALHGVFGDLLAGQMSAFVAGDVTTCDGDAKQQFPSTPADVDYSSVSFGFTRQPWSKAVAERAMSMKPTATVSLGSLSGCVKDWFSCNQALAASGVNDEDIGSVFRYAAESMGYLKAVNTTQSVSNATIEVALTSLQQSITRSFSGFTLPDSSVTVQEHELTPGIRSVSAMIEISRPVDSSSIVCGQKYCVAAVDTAPPQRITMEPVDCGVFTSALARRAVRDGKSFRETISLSFSLLYVRSSSEELSLLVDGLAHIPSSQLVSMPMHKAPLIDLHGIVLPDFASQRLTTWLPLSETEQSKKSSVSACSPVVDAFVDQLTRVAYPRSPSSLTATANTAALLYLTQPSTRGAAEIQRRLAESSEQTKLVLSIPEYSAIATFTGCGIMVLLTVFVIMRPTARVRLTPNTTPAAQYVQILTDDLYPNIVHKKRLRFINGEVLPFNEYVVDSIVLHAKRDTTKKIYLNA